MANNDRPPSKGRKTTQHDHQGDEQRQPQPGTEGPDGHLDDQPQREDEYLSSVLKEFNPQRKDRQKPVRGGGARNEIRSDPPDDDAKPEIHGSPDKDNSQT